MGAFGLGVLSSVLASIVYWSVLLFLARPRLAFSQAVVVDPSEPGFVRVKIANILPWSAQGLEFSAVVISGTDEHRIHEKLVVRSATQPILGGWANAKRRRRLYGWVGASHRIVTIGREPATPAQIGIAESLRAGSELVVSVAATDGALLSLSRWVVRAYRAEHLQRGVFKPGRSLETIAESVALL